MTLTTFDLQLTAVAEAMAGPAHDGAPLPNAVSEGENEMGFAEARQINGRPVVVQTIRSRPIGDMFAGMVKAVSGAPAPANANKAVPAVGETPHQKVFRLVSERRFEDAAKLAARFINAGDVDGFFIYGGSSQYRKAVEWFRDRVESTRRSRSTITETINPERAQVFLENNGGNRNIDPRNLSDIMRDIHGDRWDLNGQTLIVSRDGETNDGQHRGFAVLLLAATIKADISWGNTRESMKSVDIGKKRTSADRFKIKREPDYIVLAASAALAFEIYIGRRPTAAEVEDYFYANEDGFRAANTARGTAITGIGPTVSCVAAMHLLSIGADAADINTFLAAIRTGNNVKSGNPAKTIRDELYPTKRSAKPLRMKKSEWVSTLCHHFIMWKKKKPLSAVVLGRALPEAI